MEMKLNTHRIKALRLNLSWTQEKLAGKAGLNPRTIQRVEAEGSASLHTRLSIARALGVEPHELDLPESVAAARVPDDPGEGHAGASSLRSLLNPISLLRAGYHLPLLLLISLVYLAWTPIYFSLSRSNAGVWTELFVPPMTWPIVTLVFWLLLAPLWMGLVYYRYRHHIRLHLACLATLVCVSFLRVMQAEFTMTILSLALYLCGLPLLYTCYRDTDHQARIRQVFFICLATYLFVWLLQGRISTFMFGSYYRWQQDLSIPLPWVSFPTYVLRMLGEVTQLLPLALVLLFDLGRSRSNSPNTGGPASGLADIEGSLASPS